MTKQYWINLPVKDLSKSRAFFETLGFSFHMQHASREQMPLVIGDHNPPIMLFLESTFRNFTAHTIVDTKLATEVLISIDAESKEEVDEMAKKVESAGGTLLSEPAEQQGWMYGCAFADLDGHRWNVLYMDINKIAKE